MRRFLTKRRAAVLNAAGNPIIILLMLLTALTPGRAFADLVVFSDDFQSATLNSAWQLQSGGGSYTVGGGTLSYYNGGYSAATSGWVRPALTLVLPFTGTQWQIDTKATSNIVYQLSGSSTGTQAVQLLTSFKPFVQSDPNKDAAMIARGTDAWYGYNAIQGSYSGAGWSADALTPAIFCQGFCGDTKTVTDTFWYRFIRNGGTITEEYSADGSDYTTLFSASLANPSGAYNEFVLGGMTYMPAGTYTNFDYVNITATSVPEPSAPILFGVMLLTVFAGKLLFGGEIVAGRRNSGEPAARRKIRVWAACSQCWMIGTSR